MPRNWMRERRVSSSNKHYLRGCYGSSKKETMNKGFPKPAFPTWHLGFFSPSPPTTWPKLGLLQKWKYPLYSCWAWVVQKNWTGGVNWSKVTGVFFFWSSSRGTNEPKILLFYLPKWVLGERKHGVISCSAETPTRLLEWLGNSF